MSHIPAVATVIAGTLAFALSSAALARPVTSEQAACALAKARVSARGRFPISAIAFCDVIGAADSPKGYIVLALHSTRRCQGICSTHMGWFAVQKRSGRVFEWDVNDDQAGAEVKARR